MRLGPVSDKRRSKVCSSLKNCGTLCVGIQLCLCCYCGFLLSPKKTKTKRVFGGHNIAAWCLYVRESCVEDFTSVTKQSLQKMYGGGIKAVCSVLAPGQSMAPVVTQCFVLCSLLDSSSTVIRRDLK